MQISMTDKMSRPLPGPSYPWRTHSKLDLQIKSYYDICPFVTPLAQRYQSRKLCKSSIEIFFFGTKYSQPRLFVQIERDSIVLYYHFYQKNVWYFDEKLTAMTPPSPFDDTTSLNYDVLNCKGLQQLHYEWMVRVTQRN